MSINSALKGWVGEIQSTLGIKLFLDPKIYFNLNKVTIPTLNGTTQIDHVIVSRFGIFVIETKNMNGLIHGDPKSNHWTQHLSGRKFKFQNPLHQNYKHTKSLSEFLGINHDYFFSVVMFWGECEFKTPMPPNVINSQFFFYIKSFKTILFSDFEAREITSAIKKGRLPKGWMTHRKHVASLKDRFSNTTICPKCGGDLVLRTAKRGAHPGSRFYGCSKWPDCHYTKNLESNC